jgi:hypothetical protein
MKRRLRIVLALALLAVLPGCEDDESHPPETPILTANPIERRVTLSVLRRAWEVRPREVSDSHCWYERRLLDRSGYFGRKIRDTETYVEACQFWMRCVREHLESYDDKTYQGFRGR